MRVLSPDTSTITVSWTQIRKDSLNGILQGYMVFYRIFDVGNYSKITVGPSVLQATINDSLSYTDVYEVRVAGITRAGVGVKSNPLPFRPGKSLNRPELLEVGIYVNVKMTEEENNEVARYTRVRLFRILACDTVVGNECNVN